MLKKVSFILMALCCSTRLSAGFSYEVSFNNVPGLGNKVVELLLGGSAAIPVYIHETWDLTGSPESPLGTKGLKRANVFIFRASGNATITAITGNAAFSTSTPTISALGDDAQVIQLHNTGIKGTSTTAGVFSLQIATVTFTAANTLGSAPTSFAFPPPLPDAGYQIETEVIPTFGTLTIVAVPEPNSAMLMILASGLLFWRRGRKRELAGT
jgi:hypothetical protein